MFSNHYIVVAENDVVDENILKYARYDMRKQLKCRDIPHRRVYRISNRKQLRDMIFAVEIAINKISASEKFWKSATSKKEMKRLMRLQSKLYFIKGAEWQKTQIINKKR